MHGSANGWHKGHLLMKNISRRSLLIVLGAGALISPLATFAQAQGAVRSIGFLDTVGAAGYVARVEAFEAPLRELGHVPGKNIAIAYRWAADKNLKGTRPGDVPVNRATRFALTLNMRAAKAFGIAVPHTVALRADKVIE